MIRGSDLGSNCRDATPVDVQSAARLPKSLHYFKLSTSKPHENRTMLAIQKSITHKGKCTPNVLPCRIHHNGPLNASKRYWQPRTTKGMVSVACISLRITSNRYTDGKTIAYFRGRKLHRKAIKIPKGYRGVVMSSTDRILPKLQPKQPLEDEEDEEEFHETKIVEEEACFEEVMVWGHEALPEELVDPYVRGMEEWISFAETVCSVLSC
jgi:ribonuclease H2 subunit C